MIKFFRDILMMAVTFAFMVGLSYVIPIPAAMFIGFPVLILLLILNDIHVELVELNISHE